MRNVELSRPFNFLLLLLDFLLERGDHGEVVQRDVVVIVLDLVERLTQFQTFTFASKSDGY